MCKKRYFALQNEDEKWAETKHCMATNKRRATHHRHKKEREKKKPRTNKNGMQVITTENSLKRMICLQE